MSAGYYRFIQFFIFIKSMCRFLLLLVNINGASLKNVPLYFLLKNSFFVPLETEMNTLQSLIIYVNIYFIELHVKVKLKSCENITDFLPEN